MEVNILYFASVRERLKLDGESVRIGKDDCRVRDVVEKLRERGGLWGEIFAEGGSVRFAVDQEFAGLDARLQEKSELAVFPPITGG